MPQHPVEEPVRVGPHPGRIGDMVTEMTVGVQSRKPVPARFIDKDGMYVMANLL